MAKYFIQKILFLFCIIFLAGCTVQTPIPLPTTTKTPLPTTTPLPSITPIPTSTPLPATRMDIGIEGISIQPNVFTYLLNNRPAFSDSLFQTVIHPGLYKLNPDNESLLPVIANSPAAEWKKTDEALEQTIEIKPDIKWSDGTFLTANDILYSFNLLRDIALLHLGSNREILLISSIEIVSNSQIKFKVKSASASFGIEQSLLTFPVLQKNYWEKFTNQLFENQNNTQLNKMASDLDQLAAKRIQQEQVVNTLLQQMNFTRIQINNKKSKAGDKKVFLNDRKTPHNLNGVKDGEDLVRTNSEITILLGEIAELQGVLDNQAILLEGFRSKMAALIQQQQELEINMSGLTEKFIREFSDLDLSAEPLAIPYHIIVSSQNLVEINAISNQESGPNHISLWAKSGEDLAQAFQGGSLDLVFSNTSTELSTDKNPQGVADISSVILNPISDKFVNPILGQAIACIYSSPDLWEDTSLAGSISIQTYEAPPGPTLDLPGCSGPYKIRILYMRMMLDKNLYTWSYLRNGSIIPGSMVDPMGQAISPLTLAIDPNFQLPVDVQAKLTNSLKTLGIDVVISQLPKSSDLNSDRSVDIILTHWQTSQPEPDQLCSLPAYSGYSVFPLHMHSALLETCGFSSNTLSTTPQSTPTPATLPSGKETSSSYLPQTWVVLLTRDELSNYWNSASLAKYDLTWMLPLAPSWITSW
jgi:hypothetical protein